MSEANRSMYYIGICRICETGPLGLRQCGSCESIVVLCDECDAVWSDANLAASPQLSDEPELPCPHCKDSLVAPSSSWASREAIQSTAWLTEALEQGRVELKVGKPFAPTGPEDPIEPTDEPLDAGG